MTQVMAKSLFFSIALFSCTCFALASDRQEILHVRAEHADLNHSTHQGSYHGHVAVDQGSTHIRAATATTLFDAQNRLKKAIIQGDKSTKAHYWSTLSEDKPVVHAYANTMIYYPTKKWIELIGNAHIQQGQDSFEAPFIRYDLIHHHVLSQKKAQTQTKIVLHQGLAP